MNLTENYIPVMNSRRTRWARHVAHTIAMKHALSFGGRGSDFRPMFTLILDR
jgi:hypothetical protein